MDLKTATAIAKNPKSTPTQLKRSVGWGRQIDRLVAKHPNASAELLMKLSHSPDKATRDYIVLNPNTPKDVLTRLTLNLKINRSNVLIGDFPKVLDLRNCDLNLPPKTYIHFEKDFKRAERMGKPPNASFYVCGNESLEVLYLPSDVVGFDYVVIENLPNLQELHICRRGNRWSGNLQWLICRNLPNLKKITADADVLRWLQLGGMDSLESVDVSKADRLDYFSIRSAPVLKQVNVSGCKKLRGILDMSSDTQHTLGITRQIEENQAESRRDGKSYDNMTFSDVDNVLSNLNRAAKLATRQNLLPDDYCFGQENRSEFNRFSIHRLRPLEAVYTGGTGETYFYDFQAHDHINGKDGICSSEGSSELEDCLLAALNHMVDLGLEVPGLGDLEVKRRRTKSNEGRHRVQQEIDVHVLHFLNELIAVQEQKQGYL